MQGLLSIYSAWASHCRAYLVGSWAPEHAGSVVVARRLSCSIACRIFPDQGSNPWQADSYPLDQQGSSGLVSLASKGE